MVSLQDGQFPKELPQEARERLDWYKTLIGQFITVETWKGRVSAGILIKITPDHHLLIQGTYKSADHHILEIKNLEARQDRKTEKGGGGQD